MTKSAVYFLLFATIAISSVNCRNVLAATASAVTTRTIDELLARLCNSVRPAAPTPSNVDPLLALLIQLSQSSTPAPAPAPAPAPSIVERKILNLIRPPVSAPITQPIIVPVPKHPGNCHSGCGCSYRGPQCKPERVRIVVVDDCNDKKSSESCSSESSSHEIVVPRTGSKTIKYHVRP